MTELTMGCDAILFADAISDLGDLEDSIVFLLLNAIFFQVYCQNKKKNKQDKKEKTDVLFHIYP